MKKIVFVLLMLALSSCNTGRHYPPVGVWKSEYPNIILYLKQDYLRPGTLFQHLGMYTTAADDEIKIFTTFTIRAPSFSVFKTTAVRESNGSRGIHGEDQLFSGSFRVKGEQIHYTLTPAFRERTGHDVIIFHLQENYDPINPEDWFPSTP